MMSESETKPKRTKSETNNRVVWLYGTHPRVIQKAVERAFNPSGNEYYEFRNKLKADIGCPLLKVYPDIRGRFELIDKLRSTDFGTKVIILAVGQASDKHSKNIKKYKGDSYILIHPSETQYHLDTHPEGSSYTESLAERDEMKEWLDEVFEELA